MINDNLLWTSRWRMPVILLTVCVVIYLLSQTQTSPVRLSEWNGTGEKTFAGAQTIAGQAQALSGQAVPLAADTPTGNPLGSPNTVMTQGYGVGTHAPANIWGAVDLAIGINGRADPNASMDAPIYATHRGVVHLARNTYPAGNHIWVIGQHFKTGYSHLKDFAVQDGQTVERGQLIAYMGATGGASGPHLDYQVWKDGVNVNPLDYGALAGVKT